MKKLLAICIFIGISLCFGLAKAGGPSPVGTNPNYPYPCGITPVSGDTYSEWNCTWAKTNDDPVLNDDTALPDDPGTTTSNTTLNKAFQDGSQSVIVCNTDRGIRYIDSGDHFHFYVRGRSAVYNCIPSAVNIYQTTCLWRHGAYNWIEIGCHFSSATPGYGLTTYAYKNCQYGNP